MWRQIARAEHRPFTERDFPQVARWLRENDRVIDLLAAASHRPKFYHPAFGRDPDKKWTMGMDLDGWAAGFWRRGPARCIASAGALAAAARADLLACHRLARLLAEAPAALDLSNAAARSSSRDAATWPFSSRAS